MVCPNCSDMEDKVEMSMDEDATTAACPQCDYVQEL